ncbi:GGDEF domain-containing protein, partial [Escherichia coli]|uniref:GGDEF domain-containing protein n=1 Tax=Escherichia coli TaxID=562 RepID=UPI001174B2A0
PWNEFTFHAIDAGIMAEATLLALALAARLRHQQQAREQAERLARLDPLTGLYNRRAFLELAQGHFQAALRGARPMCALMLDVDHFKAIND